MASQQYFRDEHDEKLSLQSEHELIPFRLDDQLVSEGFLQAAQTPIPKILEAPPLPSSPPPLSTPSEATEATSSASARLL
jgi:hypothetical protein